MYAMNDIMEHAGMVITLKDDMLEAGMAGINSVRLSRSGNC